MQRHLEVTVFHMKATSKRVVETVVVGKVAAPLSNEEPHVIALEAVPVIAIHNFWASTGVPDKLVVNEVMSTVWAVKE